MKKVLNLFLKLRDFAKHDVQYNLIVNIKIVMGQFVTCPYDSPSIDISMSFSEFCRQSLNSFTDNFQTTHNGSF
jgi:hypothetical protein